MVKKNRCFPFKPSEDGPENSKRIVAAPAATVKVSCVAVEASSTCLMLTSPGARPPRPQCVGLGRIVISETELPNMIVSESGMKWMCGSTKRKCDRALASAGRWCGHGIVAYELWYAPLYIFEYLDGENIHRYPMPQTSLECQVSKWVNGDTCPRPTTVARGAARSSSGRACWPRAQRRRR